MAFPHKIAQNDPKLTLIDLFSRTETVIHLINSIILFNYDLEKG